MVQGRSSKGDILHVRRTERVDRKQNGENEGTQHTFHPWSKALEEWQLRMLLLVNICSASAAVVPQSTCTWEDEKTCSWTRFEGCQEASSLNQPTMACKILAVGEQRWENSAVSETSITRILAKDVQKGCSEGGNHNEMHPWSWHLEQSMDAQQMCQKMGVGSILTPMDGRLGSSYSEAASQGR